MNRYRHIFLCFIVLGASVVGKAQNPCATENKLYPKNAQGWADLETIKSNIAQAPFAKKQGDTLIFPTVVHIIHNGTVGNISDSQVVDGLRIINEDFNRENPDTSVTRDLFKPYAGAVGFKFILAKLDSNGDSTTAIVRVDSSSIPHPEPTDSDFDNCKKISHWPPDMYYNIWIVRSIQGGTLGYAQYPGTNFTYGGPWSTWGIVVKHNQWGAIGTSSADGRTGTHEVGHTFGLYHTFLSASANCGARCDTTGDEVCDTPPVNYSSGLCPTTQNTCGNDTVGPSPYDTNVVDQIENYMSYKSCQNMFSQGQKDRMRGFVASFPTLVGLSTDSNLLATGIIDALPINIEMVEARNSIKVFPNPFEKRLEVQLSTDTKLNEEDIRVVSVLGQEVGFTLELSIHTRGAHRFEIQLDPKINPGIYFLTLRTKHGKVVEKLIKN
ncbi:MAG: T9SS type A sorting domain-containing protein [Flavobacteriales bacterium]|nr:T9SS type A sorting domain-containing protein [Flavobacteriales bacterium]